MLGLLSLGPCAIAQDQSSKTPAEPKPGGAVETARAPLPDPRTLGRNWIYIRATHQDSHGPIKILEGNAEVEDQFRLIRADYIEYHEDTHDVMARGHVYFHGFEKNEQLWCDHLEYNTETEKGKFYDVRGQTMPKAVARRGVLTAPNAPFHFEGEWAERIGAKYVLYNGWVTNCKMPGPWWEMRGPKFDIIPGDRVKAYRSTFLLRKIPLFYSPYFYHSLEKEARHSGLLIQDPVPFSRRGFMMGAGYFWAINRSYDVAYKFLDYNTSAWAHHLDFRGKPAAGTDFDLVVFGVEDNQGQPGSPIDTPAGLDGNEKYSGYNVYFLGHSDLGNGWTAVGNVNYINTFRFRQEWTSSFNEAIGSEVHSTGYLNKDWSVYTLDVVTARLENYQTSEIEKIVASATLPPAGETPDQCVACWKPTYTRDAVLIHKLPELEFSGRDRQIWKNIPLWVSFYSAGGVLYRSEPLYDPTNTNLIANFATPQFTPRATFAPQITSALHLWHIDFVPSFGIEETYYGASQALAPAQVSQQVGYTAYGEVGTDLIRSTRNFSMDVILPSLARVFNKKTIFGDKLKHVIEPRVSYHYVSGIGMYDSATGMASDFDRFIRFDETDLVSDTNNLEISLTNRLYAKRGDSVQEILTWELKQQRYFDPTFGGALIPGQANVFAATADLMAYSFLVGPRSSSPVVSIVRARPINGLTINWQADYDPRYHGIVDSSLSIEYRWKLYGVSAGNNEVHLNPQVIPGVIPPGNQYRAGLRYGETNKRGVNAGFDAVYDVRQGVLQYMTSQVTYNTDCCGISVQYRIFNVGSGIPSRPSISIAFSIANVGTTGNLKKQDRMF